jgi:hypothetical protein
MLPLLLAAAAAPQIYKGIKGLIQKNQAKKIDDTRPVYEMPNQISQNVDMYNNLANASRLPGQALIENNLNAGLASDINAIRQTGGSSTNQLAAISNLNANRNKAVSDLGIQAAQFRVNAMDKMANAKGVMAQYKDKEFDYNKNQEFQYRRMKKDMLNKAGDQNIFGGIEGLANLGGQYAAYKMY